MEIVRTVAWMKQLARQAQTDQRIIGFVPTMGALHAGHMALVERAIRECSPVYSSIFVNPKQFGPQEDLSRYPRPIEADQDKLASAGVEALFLPPAEEIYPPGFSTFVQVDGLSERWEGRSRPGHFRGVSTVVLKLLEIVRPQLRLLRPQRCPTSSRRSANGTRPESGYGDCGLPNCSRARWPRDEFPQRLPQRRGSSRSYRALPSFKFCERSCHKWRSRCPGIANSLTPDSGTRATTACRLLGSGRCKFVRTLCERHAAILPDCCRVSWQNSFDR